MVARVDTIEHARDIMSGTADPGTYSIFDGVRLIEGPRVVTARSAY